MDDSRTLTVSSPGSGRSRLVPPVSSSSPEDVRSGTNGDMGSWGSGNEDNKWRPSSSTEGISQSEPVWELCRQVGGDDDEEGTARLDDANEDEDEDSTTFRMGMLLLLLPVLRVCCCELLSTPRASSEVRSASTSEKGARGETPVDTVQDRVIAIGLIVEKKLSTISLGVFLLFQSTLGMYRARAPARAKKSQLRAGWQRPRLSGPSS